MRRAIAVTLATVGLLLLTYDLTAQVGSMRVTVPSPTAATLGKFGDIPVSLFTGVPDISIPFLTAQGRTLQVPVVLRYHASGIKVEEIGGWAGIGWTLEAGGAITRTVRGIVDERLGGYYNSGSAFYDNANWPNPPKRLLDNIRMEYVDGEPDQFFFDFGGRSGQFVMGPATASPNLREVRTIPYQKIQIQPSISGEQITSFLVTTEDGTRYTFGGAATELSTDLNSLSPHYNESWASTWQLTGIRAPGGDSITLYYTPYTVWHRIGTYQEDTWEVWSMPGEPCGGGRMSIPNADRVLVQRLDSIKTAAHTARFTIGAALRADALNNGVPQEPRLDAISVTTPTGTVLRTFKLEHDYSTGRLTLKHVYEVSRNGDSLPPYSFTYNPEVLPSTSSFAQDHWGYYSGRTWNSGLLPTVTSPRGTVIGGIDRSPDLQYTQAGILTKITYPTGGYNEFIYEANEYWGLGEQQGQLEWVDLYSDPATPPQSINFTVGGTNTVTGTLWVDYPIGADFCETHECAQVGIDNGSGINTPGNYPVSLTPGTHTLWIWGTGYEEAASGHVEWQTETHDVQMNKTGGGLRVAEIRAADGMGNQATTTIRKYKYGSPTQSSGVINAEPAYGLQYDSPTCTYFSRSSMSRVPLGGGPSVSYSGVSVWHGASGEYGKTDHVFQNGVDPAPDGVVWPFSRRTNYAWARGQELQTIEYDAAARLQHRTDAGYQFHDDPAADPEPVRRFRGLSIHPYSAGAYDTTVYYYGDFEVIAPWTFQSSEGTTFYDTTGSTSFSTSKAFTYGNPKHVQLTQVTETNSDGTQRITRMKYPADYAPAPGTSDPMAAALTAMQGSAHIHNAVIERSVSVKTGASDRVVQAEITTFKEFATGQFLPFKHYVFNSPSPVP
jgi:hypothetical protein